MVTETNVAFDAKVCLTLLGSAVGGTCLQPLQKVPAGQAKAQGPLLCAVGYGRIYNIIKRYGRLSSWEEEEDIWLTPVVVILREHEAVPTLSYK